MAHTVIACSGTTMPYVPRVDIAAIGIDGGAHVKMADFGPTQTAEFKLYAQLRFATGFLRQRGRN